MPVLAVTAPFGFDFDPVRFLAAYRAVGVSTAQFYRNEQKPPTVKEALAAANAAGVRFDSIHGVFGFHLDPSSPRAEHREQCLKVYESEGKLASDLGGPMVVVHPAAFNPGMRMMTLDEAAAASQGRWDYLHQFLLRLGEIGQRLGVVYLIENQPPNTPLGHDAARLARAVEAVKSPNIRMCLDTGHAHFSGDVAEATRACAGVVEYFHVHDNDAKVDDHRMPGDGTIDWKSWSGALRQTGNQSPRMLEVFYDEARVEQLGREGLAARLKAACAL